MHRRPASHTFGYVLSLLLCMAWNVQAADRSDCERNFKPETGQSGKDVIWVPTNDRLVTRMLQMAAVNPSDLVYDLGAGDGKIAIAAASQFGARAIGVEYNPQMAELAQCYAEAEGVADRVRIVQGDIFETDFSDASVITLYLLPELNVRLRPTILKMKPGTRVVSHSFMMDTWEPDERSVSDDGQAYMWIVPAQVQGTWVFRREDGKDSFNVRLNQVFQEITGRKGSQPLGEATLHGAQLTLAFTEDGAVTRLVGEVEGNRMNAQVTRDGTTSSYVGTLRGARR